MKNALVKNVKACGKLYIAGEYSILTPYQSAIIKNINIFMSGTIQESSNIFIYSDMFENKIEEDDELTIDSFLNKINTINSNLYKEYKMILKSICIFFEYYKNIKNDNLYNIKKFKLNITGKMLKYGKKYGIGSSGCVVVLVIRAMASFYNIKLTNDELFKLSVYILLELGDNGSMGDVACISYNTTVYYQSFDRKLVKQWISKNGISVINNKNWGYKIEPISFDFKNIDVDFIVGWTKEEAISKNMINLIKKDITNNFLDETEKIVKNLYFMLSSSSDRNYDKFQNVDFSVYKFKDNINKSLFLLQSLNKNIVTDKLSKLIESVSDMNCCSKISGAGGGDCGISFLFHEKTDSEDKKNIVREIFFNRWKNNDIDLLYFEKL